METSELIKVDLICLCGVAFYGLQWMDQSFTEQLHDIN